MYFHPKCLGWHSSIHSGLYRWLWRYSFEMNIEIVEERENPFIDRREILLRIDHLGEATPGKKEVLRFLVDRMGLEPEKIFIAWVRTYTGTNRSEALIYYYPEGIDWSTIEPTKRGKVIKLGEEESEA